MSEHVDIDLTTATPSRDVVIGHTRIAYGLGTDGVEIQSIRTPRAKRRRGSARAALETFLAAADARGLSVKLGASPLDKVTRLDKLVAFYRSLGFETTGRTINMAGEPEMMRSAAPRTTQAVDVAPLQTDTAEFQKWFAGSKVVDESGKPLVVYHGTHVTAFIPARFIEGSTAAQAELESMAAAHGIADWMSVAVVFERWVDSQKDVADAHGVTADVARHARDLMTAAKATQIAAPNVAIGFDVFNMPAGDNELGAHFGSEYQASRLGTAFPFVLSMRNPVRLPDLGTWNYQRVIRELQKRGVNITDREYDAVVNAANNNDALRDLLLSKGIDGVVYANESEGAGDSYIAFRPEQIKSAIGNNGSFDAANLDIRFSQPSADPFYSALVRSVATAQGAPKRADATAWKQWLDGAQRRGEFKQSERDWTGVDAWLDGRALTTRDEIVAFVRDNQVEIQEVLLGDAGHIDAEVEAWWNDEGGANEDVPYGDLSPDEQQEARKRYSDDVGQWAPNSPETKFAQYQLPGGQHYRELLLTMPSRAAVAFTPYDTWAEDRRAAGKSDSHAAYKIAKGTFFSGEHTAKDFQSPHFDFTNILAHVRFNERVDATGKRVLFIEELQSDWGQAKRAGKNVPDAPLIGQTAQWSMTAMKRMIRWASEHGFDAIAWAPGEQQAARYDLSKQVEEVNIFRHPDGQYYDVSARTKNERKLVDTATRVSESALAAQVGKDLAEKATKQAPRSWQTYSGIDLKVGGEGLRAFYDEILPNQLAKYIKPWDAKVGTTTINITPHVGDNAYVNPTVTGEWRARFGRDSVTMATEAEAQAWLDQKRAPAVVPSIDITPAMRASAMAGQPLFSQPAVSRSDVQSEAKRLGLPATGPTAAIATLVRIANTPASRWSRADFETMLPHLAVHQNFKGAHAPETVAAILRDGLKTGMVDCASALEPGAKQWSWAKGYAGHDAYVFIRGGLQYAGASNPRLAPGNIPLFHVPSIKGGSLWDALQRNAGMPFDQQDNDKTSHTTAFRDWFGASKVVDANGDPMVVYHGTTAPPFDAFRFGVQPHDAGMFFTNAEDTARDVYGRGRSEFNAAGVLAALNAMSDEHVESFIAQIMKTYSSFNFGEHDECDEHGAYGAGYAVESVRDELTKYLAYEFDPDEDMDQFPEYAAQVLGVDPRSAHEDTRVERVYLSLQNPLVIDAQGDEFEIDQQAKWLEQAKAEGRDGVIISHYNDGGYGGLGAYRSAGEHTVYIAFRPDQIKSVECARNELENTIEQPFYDDAFAPSAKRQRGLSL